MIIRANAEPVPVWKRFFQSMLTNSAIIFAPKLKEYKLLIYNFGRLNGFFHALSEGGVNEMYNAHPDFQRIVLDFMFNVGGEGRR